jgi:5-(carboxyamino)imidazole ribonucleotide mutase
MIKKPLVGIVIGSDSDLTTIAETTKTLNSLEIPFELTISSAHRTLDKTIEYVNTCEKKGVEVFIVAAGMAAHLAGVIAGITILPVIGIPIHTKELNGLDSLYSIVQMPKGVPVATVTIGKHGAVNAAILAAQILSIKHNTLKKTLKTFKNNMKKDIYSKNSKLQKLGIDQYIHQIQQKK